jgi:hypothetical protein
VAEDQDFREVTLVLGKWHPVIVFFFVFFFFSSSFFSFSFSSSSFSFFFFYFFLLLLLFFSRARRIIPPLCTVTLGLLWNPKYSIQHRFSSPVPRMKRQRSLTEAVLISFGSTSGFPKTLKR